MVTLIAGGTHTGKTRLAQRVLEAQHVPYLSLDHLKRGLIRSGMTQLTPCSSDEALTQLLWPIAVGILCTAVENGQDLVIEGCYIPFDYKRYVPPAVRAQLQYVCLIFSEAYIRNHLDAIRHHACVIEQRIQPDEIQMDALIRENAHNLRHCRALGCHYIWVDTTYDVDVDDLPRPACSRQR